MVYDIFPQIISGVCVGVEFPNTPPDIYGEDVKFMAVINLLVLRIVIIGIDSEA